MRRIESFVMIGALGAAIAVAPQLATGAARVADIGSAAGAPLRDPALRTGTLPNGLRYYIRANAAPAHRAELRLAVNAGSVLEDDDQQGFAHFLEHMAFNGTRHFPHNSLIDFVEGSGMSFGADLNAYTSPDETVYMLTVPTDDPKILAQGLTVLQDWASGGMTIDSAEVVAERGVVMGEWRMRLVDTASQRLRDHADSVVLGDSRYRHRMPIGLPSLIEKATAAPIARFYHDWYRPDLMAVVVVGDFDAAQMEREVRTRFGAIPAPAKPRPRTVPKLPSSAEPVVDVLRDNVSPRLQVLWPTPAQPADPTAAFHQELVAQLLEQEIQRTLFSIRNHPSRPFVTANPVRGRYVRPLSVRGVSIIAVPDSLERALGTVLAELERLAQRGPPAPALALEKAALLRQLEGDAASAAAHSSAGYANGYVYNYLTGETLLASPAQELALARRLLPQITPAVIAEAARFWRERAGLRVLVGFPQFSHAPVPTRERILAIFDSVAHTPLAPDSARAVAEGPLMATLPKPGRIVGEKHDDQAGITEWTLSNGARVLFKPSRSNPDELLLRAWSPGGFSLVPDSLFYSSGRMVGILMTEAAGLGAHAHDDLMRQLSTTGVRNFRVQIGYADESIDLAGSPRDLTTLFQMLYLQFTAPTLDTAAVASWRSLAKYQPRPFSLDDQLTQTFARGNERMVPVQTFLADLVSVPEAMAVYHDRFGNAGDFTFLIVGAATPTQVKPLVERYLASLPSTGKHDTPIVPDVAPFATRLRSKFPFAMVPRSDALLVFDGAFPTDPDAYLRERERLGVLTGIVNKRLRERLREQLGGTYSPQVGAQTYLLPPEHYRVRLLFNSAPERMDELDHEMFKLLDSVRTVGATPEELAAQVRIQRRRLETMLQDDRYWLSTMELYHRLGIPLDRIVSPFPEARMTPTELAAVARTYLPKSVYIHMISVPRDSALYTEADSSGEGLNQRVH
jgi:zinc protease